jgi:predicted DCC family thiol-disulfide oxidoreductase YuxK
MAILRLEGESTERGEQLVESFFLVFNVPEDVQCKYRKTVLKSVAEAVSAARKVNERTIAAFRESGASKKQIEAIEVMLKESSKETLLFMANRALEPSWWRRLRYKWAAKNRVRGYNARFMRMIQSDFRNINFKQVLNRMERNQ